jgi:transposase
LIQQLCEPINTPQAPEKNIAHGTSEQELGRSPGGFTTKIHATCDALGNPIRFLLSPGERSDYTKALDLIEGFDLQKLLADKGYDAQYIIDYVGENKAVIPPRSLRKVQRNYDIDLYKERNLIERMFNKLKHFRRVATRYDKLASSFLSFIHLAASLIWLK